jgi:hypothetical protein
MHQKHITRSSVCKTKIEPEPEPEPEPEIKEETRKYCLLDVFGIHMILTYVHEHLMIELCEYNWFISDCYRLIYMKQLDKIILIDLYDEKSSIIQHLSINKPILYISLNNTVLYDKKIGKCWEKKENNIQLADTVKWFRKLSELASTINSYINNPVILDVIQLVI